MEIKGISAIVTGGASGLGEASVRQLAKNGATVSILDLNVERGEQIARELGDAAIFCKTDISREPDVQEAMEKAVAKFGAVHLALNCAGIIGPAKVVSKKGAIAIEQFNQVIQVNLVGTMTVIKHAAIHMVNNAPTEDGERGVIINTASVAAFDGQIGQAAYSSSKAGIVGMTLPLAREFAENGIRVVTIAPGLFDTPMMASLPDKIKTSLINMIPFPKRLAKPSEFASLVQHIAENPILNGETIRLDQAIRMGAK